MDDEKRTELVREIIKLLEKSDNTPADILAVSSVVLECALTGIFGGLTKEIRKKTICFFITDFQKRCITQCDRLDSVISTQEDK